MGKRPAVKKECLSVKKYTVFIFSVPVSMKIAVIIGRPNGYNAIA